MSNIATQAKVQNSPALKASYSQLCNRECFDSIAMHTAGYLVWCWQLQLQLQLTSQLVDSYSYRQQLYIANSQWMVKATCVDYLLCNTSIFKTQSNKFKIKALKLDGFIPQSNFRVTQLNVLMLLMLILFDTAGSDFPFYRQLMVVVLVRCAGFQNFSHYSLHNLINILNQYVPYKQKY